MKKVALSLAVIATMAMVSCGGQKAENNDSVMDTVDTAVAIEETAAVDTTDSTVTEEVAVAAEEVAVPAEEAKEEAAK